jgi:hypothetical protein
VQPPLTPTPTPTELSSSVLIDCNILKQKDINKIIIFSSESIPLYTLPSHSKQCAYEVPIRMPPIQPCLAYEEICSELECTCKHALVLMVLGRSHWQNMKSMALQEFTEYIETIGDNLPYHQC